MSSRLNTLKDAFKDNAIIPDVINVAPENVLSVEYNKSGKKVEVGNTLTPKQVQQIPKVEYQAEQNAYYTLIMTDPDAPSRKNPVKREWNHWLVGNIPGTQVEKGENIREYIGSAPPSGTGLHRYVFLLYKQPEKLKFDEPYRSDTDGKRGNFSTLKFAEKYRLGAPVSGNYFQAEYDDSVPAVHRRLKS